MACDTRFPSVSLYLFFPLAFLNGNRIDYRMPIFPARVFALNLSHPVHPGKRLSQLKEKYIYGKDIKISMGKKECLFLKNRNDKG
jgi:hypothetical protein